VERAPFGRTNLELPRLWLRLATPDPSSLLDGLIEAATDTGAPLDVSAPAALWGSRLKNASNLLLVRAALALEHTAGGAHSAGQVEAHLFETLCSLQRERVDFYFLRIDSRLGESQLAGALEALENARTEGHLRFLGLEFGGDGTAARSAWHLHDAFESVMVADANLDASLAAHVEALAAERRVGLVRSVANISRTGAAAPSLGLSNPPHPILVTVSTADEIRKFATELAGAAS
jgi:hypothetical protein